MGVKFFKNFAVEILEQEMMKKISQKEGYFQLADFVGFELSKKIELKANYKR